VAMYLYFIYDTASVTIIMQLIYIMYFAVFLSVAAIRYYTFHVYLKNESDA